MIETYKAVMRKPLIPTFFMVAAVIALMSAANSISMTDIDAVISNQGQRNF